MGWSYVRLCNFAHHFKGHGKGWAFSKLTFNYNLPTHLFNDWFANAEPKTTTLRIRLLVLLKVPKVDEKIVYLIGWNANTEVLDT